jgi:hypothetical protein
MVVVALGEPSVPVTCWALTWRLIEKTAAVASSVIVLQILIASP